MTTLAARVGPGYNYSYPEGIAADRLFRIFFYNLTVTEDGTYDVGYLNSTRCSDKYAE